MGQNMVFFVESGTNLEDICCFVRAEVFEVSLVKSFCKTPEKSNNGSVKENPQTEKVTRSG